jgi:hypothetical protein
MRTLQLPLQRQNHVCASPATSGLSTMALPAHSVSNSACSDVCCCTCYLQCGVGLTTEKNGSVAFDQCRIKPGWGIKSFIPLEAEMCNNSRYGDPALRPVVASARCVPCSPNLFTLDTLTGNATNTGYTSEQVGWSGKIPAKCSASTQSSSSSGQLC